ncbi:DUF6444 domain-containing protein [Candidatus Enterovibrio escicola]
MEELDSEQANELIRKLWDNLREYEDWLSASSRNSSCSTSSNSFAARD